MSSRCPTPGIRGFKRDPSGAYVALPCGRLLCGGCGPVLALGTVSAIRLARFDRCGVLSVAAPELVSEAVARAAGERMRALMRHVVAGVRNRGFVWEHVSTVELSAQGRPHVHFLQRGDPVPSSVLLEIARSVGAGWTAMEPVRHPGQVARYILKHPLSGLALEPSEAAEVMSAHGVLNAWRLVSYTRGFWRDLDGVALGGVRQARQAARVAWRAGWKP
jgi:hypothetical protein